MGENEQENETVVLRDWMKMFMPPMAGRQQQREGSGRGNAQLSNGIRQFYICRLINLLINRCCRVEDICSFLCRVLKQRYVIFLR